MMAGTEAGKQYATILSGVMLTHTILPEQSDTRYLCKCVSRCKLFIQVFIISKPYLQLQKPAYRSHSTSTPHMSTTSTMDQQNELELAKQGNAKSIAVLMNHRLQPKGITAKTDLYKGRLQVNLEYAKLRDQQALVTFVCKVILSLKPASIHKVRSCGLRTDLGHTVWIHEFELGMQTNLESVLFAIDKNQNSLSTFAPSSSEVKASPEAEVKCPKCYSTQLSINKKGFGLGKATVGAVLLGPVGLIGGMWGSNQLSITCLRCGHQWKPGKT